MTSVVKINIDYSQKAEASGARQVGNKNALVKTFVRHQIKKCETARHETAYNLDNYNGK